MKIYPLDYVYTYQELSDTTICITEATSAAVMAVVLQLLFDAARLLSDAATDRGHVSDACVIAILRSRVHKIGDFTTTMDYELML